MTARSRGIRQNPRLMRITLAGMLDEGLDVPQVPRVMDWIDKLGFSHGSIPFISIVLQWAHVCNYNTGAMIEPGRLQRERT